MVEFAGGVGDGSGKYISLELVFTEFILVLAALFEVLRGGVFRGELFTLETLAIFAELVFCSEAFDVKIEIIRGNARRNKAPLKTNLRTLFFCDIAPPNL